MNWLSRKLLVSVRDILTQSLSKFFKNVQQKDVDVNVMFNQHIRLRNLELKTDMIPMETSPVLLSQCRIGYLQLAFDPMKLMEEPVTVKITDVLVILKLNPDVKTVQETYKRDYIRDYYKQILTTEDTTNSSTGSEGNQLLNWIVDLALRKINIFIERVTVALEYSNDDRPHNYIGASIEEIKIKSRTVVATNRTDKVEQKQLECLGVGLFVGYKTVVKEVEKLGYNSEKWYLDNYIKKLYFLKNLMLSVVVVLQDKKLSVVVNNFLMNVSPHVLRQVYNIIRYVQPLTSKRPILRPGKGARQVLRDAPNVSEGCRDWWRYTIKRVLNRVQKNRQYNVLLNWPYRRYVHCIFCSIIYGATPELTREMEKFEINKNKVEILQIHQMVLEKIRQIRDGMGDEIEHKVYVMLIMRIGMDPRWHSSFGRLTYNDIRNYDGPINMAGGQKYIKMYELKNIKLFQITLDIPIIRIYLTEYNIINQFQQLAAQQLQFKKELEQMQMKKQEFNDYIDRMYDNFIRSTMAKLSHEMEERSSAQWTPASFEQSKTCFGKIVFKRVFVKLETVKNIKAQLESIQIDDLAKVCYYPKFLELRNLSVKQRKIEKTNLTFTVEENGFDVSLDYVSLTMLKPFVQKLLFLGSLIIFDMDRAKQVQNQIQPTMEQTLHNNLFKSKYFKDYVKTSINLKVRKVNVLLPIDYTIRNDILALQIIGAQFCLNSTQFRFENQSIKVLFINSFKWVDEDNIIKRRLKRIDNPNDDEIEESVVVSLGHMNIMKATERNDQVRDYMREIQQQDLNRSMPRRQNQRVQNPEEFIDKLEFIIPLIMIRLSLKEFFYIQYLIRLWTQTGFTPQRFFKRKKNKIKRSDHSRLGRRQQLLMRIMIRKFDIEVKGVMFSMCTVRQQQEKDEEKLFQLFVNNIKFELRQYSFGNEINLRVADIFMKNITAHLPMQRIFMLRFVERLLKHSDLHRARNARKRQSLQDLMEDLSDMDQSIPRVNLPNFNTIQLDHEEIATDSILESYAFRQEQRNPVRDRLILFNEGQKKAFLTVKVFNKYEPTVKQEQTSTKVDVSTIHITAEVEFIKNFILVYETAKDFSLRRMNDFFQFIETKGYIPSIERDPQVFQQTIGTSEEQQILAKQSDIIMDQPTGVNQFAQIKIDRVNVMIWHKFQTVYCITVGTIDIKMNNLFHYNELSASVGDIILVDTSLTSGPWKNIISLDTRSGAQIRVVLKTFKSMPMIRRVKCQNQLIAKIKDPVVTLALKKILELVNCMMLIMGKVDSVSHKFKKEKIKLQPDPDKRFNFQAQIQNVSIKLVQNSLEPANFFNLIVDFIDVRNTPPILDYSMKEQDTKPSFHSKMERTNDFGGFQPCDRTNDDFEFQSFHDEPVKIIDSQEKIYITVKSIYINSGKTGILSNIQLLKVTEIGLFIEVGEEGKRPTSVTVTSSYPIDISLDEKQFAKLMKIVMQNFIERPTVFDDEEVEREKRITREIDDKFFKQQNPDCSSPFQKHAENQTQFQRNMVTVSIHVKVDEVVFNTYNEDYNMTLIVKTIQFDMDMTKGNSRHMIIGVRKIQYFNNDTNRMFINTDDYSGSSPMMDGFEMAQNPSFTKERSRVYTERAAEEYHFKPKYREDLEIMNRSKTTYMEGWSQEMVVQPKKNYQRLLDCLDKFCCRCRSQKHQAIVAQAMVNVAETETLLHRPIQQHFHHHYEHFNVAPGDPDAEQSPEQVNKSQVSEHSILKRHYYHLTLTEPMRVDQFMRMAIHMTSTGQMNMQMEIRNINIAVTPNKQLLYLTNYIVKGILEANQNDRIKQAKTFNNYPPLYFSMKIHDCRALIGKSLDQGYKNYMEAVSSVEVTQENVGDITNGPGSSKLQVNAKAYLQFCRFFQHKTHRHILSDIIFMSLIQDSNIPVNYDSNIKYEPTKQIFLSGPDEMVYIKVPLTFLKSIIDTITPLSPETKPPEGHSEVVFQKQQTPQQIIKFLFSLITNNIRLIVPRIKVELFRGRNKSLLYLDILKTYMQIISLSTKTDNYKEKMQYAKMRIYLTLAGEYLNMKINQFQPFIEPFKLCLKLRDVFQKMTIRKKFRIGSVSRSAEFQNPFNINISLGLIRNLKEALTRFQGNFSVQNDYYADLTDRTRHAQLSESEEQRKLNAYGIHRSFIDSFFGRKFIKVQPAPEDEETRKRYWNIRLREYIVLHSFFDYKNGRKIVHFRTPFRIFNFLGEPISLIMRENAMSKVYPQERHLQQWTYTMEYSKFYAVPKSIYENDIWVSFSFKNMDFGQGISMLVMLSEFEQRSMFTNDLSRRLNTRVFKLSSDNPDKFIRREDFRLRCDGKVILALCVKSEYEINKSDRDDRYVDKLHETSILLFPPIILKNQLPIYMDVIIGEKTYSLPATSETSITDLPYDFINCNMYLKKNGTLGFIPIFAQEEDSKVYFIPIARSHSLSIKVTKLSQLAREVTLFSSHQVRNLTYQDFNISYEDRNYIIEKYYWQFISNEMDNTAKKKKAPSRSLGSKISSMTNKGSGKGKISFIEEGYKSANIDMGKQSQIIKVLRRNPEPASIRAQKLVIEVPPTRNRRQLQGAICDNRCCRCCYACCNGCLQYLKTMAGCKDCTGQSCTRCLIRCGMKCSCENCCKRTFSPEGFCGDCRQGCCGPQGCCAQCITSCSQQCQQRGCKCSRCCAPKELSVDPSILVYEICTKSIKTPQNLSNTLLLFYRYEIVNTTNTTMILFHHNTELMRLEPNIRRQLYYYQGDSEWFRIALYREHKGQLLFSDMFKVNASRQFTVRIPKQIELTRGVSVPADYNYLYVVRISEVDDMLFIKISDIDMNRFPMYLQNSTEHNIRIIEGEQDFVIPSMQKYKFFFTNLDFEKGSELILQIQDMRKIIKMNEMSDLESLSLDDFLVRKPPLIERSSKTGRLSINFKDYHGEYNVVLDILKQQFIIFDEKLRHLHTVDLKQASLIDNEGNKLYIYLPHNDQLLLSTRETSTQFDQWRQAFNDCISLRTGQRIFLTVDSDRFSRIIKIQQGTNEIVQSIKKTEVEVFIKSFTVAIISSEPLEVIIVNLANIHYQFIEDLKRPPSEKMFFVTYDHSIVLGKLKLSNQIQDTANPVVAAQSKKTNNPCFEVKMSKRFSVEMDKLLPKKEIMLVSRVGASQREKLKQTAEKLHLRQNTLEGVDRQIINEMRPEYEKQPYRFIAEEEDINKQIEQQRQLIEALRDPSKLEIDDSFSFINHFTIFSVFLDEIEIMIDAGLALRILEIIQEIQKTWQMYDLKSGKPIAIEIPDINEIRRKVYEMESNRREIYINYLNIEPIKIIASITWNFNSEEEFRGGALDFLRILPFGIKDAVIQLKSFTTYHVFEKRQALMNRILRYYRQSIIVQAVRNAGSFELLAPLKIINGIGEGARNIFYEPMYTLYRKRQLKSTAKKCLEGCLTFISFIFKFILLLFQLVFKIVAFFTFDKVYIQKREAFHKQTMKSPKFGFFKGGRWFISMFKEFFIGFLDKPLHYRQRFGFCGIFLGLIVAILGILKIIVGLFDFIWAILDGFINYATYEPDAMTVRSRPIRIFKNGQITRYNYFESLALEIMRNANIETLDGEIIHLATKVPYRNKVHYYIISNYRFIYASENHSKSVIRFYKIREIDLINYTKLVILLGIPDTKSYFFCTSKKWKYEFYFQRVEDAEHIRNTLLEAHLRSRYITDQRILPMVV